EAIRLTLGARDHCIAITGGLFKHPLGLTTRLGNYPIGVGFSLVLLALLIFTSTNHVIKGFLDFARRSRTLQIDLSHDDAGAVVVEEALQTLLDLAGHGFTTLGQDLVHR